jgi:hypothetical protein
MLAELIKKGAAEVCRAVRCLEGSRISDAEGGSRPFPFIGTASFFLISVTRFLARAISDSAWVSSAR